MIIGTSFRLRYSWSALFFTLLGLFYGLSRPAEVRAGLLSNVQYERRIFSRDRNTGIQTSTDPFFGSSLPASGTLTKTGVEGGSMKATYSFTENAAGAEFSISTDYIAGFNESYDEKSDAGNSVPISFHLNHAANYTLTITVNIVNPNAGNVLTGTASAILFDGQRLTSDSVQYNRSVSGTVAKGTNFGFVATTGGGAAPYGSAEGHTKITVTLVALPDAPPKLSDFADRQAQVDQQLALTATATDADSPKSSLRYSLGAGAPTGAVLDPVSGLFTWTPTPAQGMGIFNVSITVADDSSPPLTDTKSFTIKVCQRDGLGNVVCPEAPVDRVGKKLGKTNGNGSCCVGDPIDIGSGNQFDEITDFRTAGANPLFFTRHYNSLSGPTNRTASLGGHWRSTFDRYLRFSFAGGTPILVVAERADGKELSFVPKAGGWASDSDMDVKLAQAGANWILTDTEDNVETYTVVGDTAWLVSIKARNGFTQTLNYGAGQQLQSVSDSFGRRLQFDNQGGLLRTMTVPDGLVLTYSYDSSGTPVGITNRLIGVAYSTVPPTGLAYLYENPSLPFALTGLTDEKGNRFTSWTHDPAGRALSSQNSGAVDLNSMAYQDADGSRTVTGPLGAGDVYRFGTLQGVPKVAEVNRIPSADFAAARFTRSYDSNGYLTNSTDWKSNATRYANDVRGLPINIVAAAGTPQERTTSISYHPVLRLPTGIVAPGKTTGFVRDDGGNVLTLTETDTSTNGVPYSSLGQTRTWSNTFDSFGHLLSAAGPRTDVTATASYSYETNGYVSAITNALGHVTRITSYNDRGLPLESVDPNGVTNRFTYHPRGWLLSRAVLAASGNATNSFAYDAAGLMTNMALPDGSQLTYFYDSAHRLRAVTNSLGEGVAYTLDAAGNITRQDTGDSQGHITKTQSRVFDALGRVLRDIGANGQTNNYAYDGNGNTVSIRDGLNRTTTNVFDALNRLVRVIDPLNNPVTYAYDAQDNLVSVTDPRSLTTSYIYDGFGQVIQEISPDSGTTVYVLDKAGNRVSQTDARGIVTLRTFDKLDRVTSETFPASPSENIAYSYDATADGNKGIGRLTGFTDESGNTTFVYDERGNVISTTRTIGATVYTTAYVYDLADRVIRVIYPSGHVIGYGRDSLGRISSMTYRPSGGGAVTVLATNIGYAPFGPMTTLLHGNGLTRSMGYDLDYRLTNITTSAGANGIQSLAMTYDAANNITAILDKLAPERSQTFGYDENYRLTQASGVYGPTTYSYDGVGNRLSRTSRDETETYSYAPTANRLQAVAKPGVTRSFAYTAGGNTSSDNRGNGSNLLFGYGGRNRLNTLTNGGIVAGYRYNALDQRVAKTVSGSTIHFHYDQGSHLIAESTSAGALIREYVWLGDMPVAQVEGNGAIYFIHTDHLNTPQKMTDVAKTVVWDREQQPFGEPVPLTVVPTGFNGSGKFQMTAHNEANRAYAVQGSTALGGSWTSLSTNMLPFSFTDTLTPPLRFYRAAYLTNATVSITNNLRFPGQYFDAESGLHYNMMRDYDTSTGRYVQNDPIGIAGGINQFGYASGDPLGRSDALGLYDYNDLIIDSVQSLNGFSDAVTMGASQWARQQLGTDEKTDYCSGAYGGGEIIGSLAGNANLLTAGGKVLLKGARLGIVTSAAKTARQGPVIIGETMVRVEAAAAKYPGAKILNDMPDFRAMGMNPDQVTSAMLAYNRKWILEQMRSGRQIIDIGADVNRAKPSIFYEMEQNMLKNYQKLHPEFNGVTRP